MSHIKDVMLLIAVTKEGNLYDIKLFLLFKILVFSFLPNLHRSALTP